MKRPTTIRIDDTLLKAISRFAKKAGQDKTQYIRFLLLKGFEEDRKERVIKLYSNGKMSMEEARTELELDVWEFLSLLEERNKHLNVTTEDWLDSAKV
ncbi:MAG: hypothetical protein GXP58_10815 [Deltaproteobacteria bacterium]|nr:hypothetical protein [Deltaproteobacteria bacterium]